MSDDALTAAEADVFVSHASSDAALADSIVTTLEHRGLRCWIAHRDAIPGSLYADGIIGAINGTKVFVLVLSKHAISSAHVSKEVERASSKRRSIIAIRTDSAPLTHAFEYFLSESQWIDLPTDDNDAAFAKLAEAVGRHVELSRADVAVTEESDHSPISQKSIAILPFTDMSEKKDQEYFGDGMAEEIINLLARVPELLVSARTSSFYFKGKQTKIPDIARELGVVHVLEGSIRRSGNRLRVTVQLVRAKSGYPVWSETYNRELRDVFELQDDIANAVAQALQIKLAGGELTRQKGGTQNLDAYQLYLRALSGYAQNTKSSMDAASEYLEQAINLDSSYGMAWSLLAAIANFKAAQGLLDVTEGFERARHFAERVLQLSPDNVGGHLVLVWVYQHDWDWAAAETEVRRALAIDPTSPDALGAAGWLSLAIGRLDEAEQQFLSARARDPLNTWLIFLLGRVYYGAGRFTDAEDMFRTLLTLAPGFMMARVNLGATLMADGKPEAALAIVQEDERHGLLILSQVLLANGREAEADAALDAQIARYGDSGAYWAAATYANRHDADLAFRWLERAYKYKDPTLGLGMVGNRQFQNIANDPRYVAFLRKMNLPV